MVKILLLLSFIILIFQNYFCFQFALPCAGCHGTNGNSPGKTIPSIKNLEKSYFIKAFEEYKNGTRSHYIMKIIANGYSDEEVENIS